MWQEKTAEQAYNLAFAAEIDYRLPHHPTATVAQFSHWQGEDGSTYTGQYVAYLEGSDTPHILSQYDTVLVRASHGIEG